MNPLTIAGIILVVIPSITSHEAAHGIVADRLGDPTAREAGRLTLNPIPHIDLFFTILLPAFLILSGSGFIFGGAKPVPVNVSRLRNPRRDWALVGAAGPVTNVLLALLLSAVLSLFLHTGLWNRSSIGTEVLTVGIFVNILLAIFNLVPIPPLDGSRIVQYFLSGDALRAYRSLERYGLLVIVALVLFIPPFQMFLTQVILDSMAVVTGAFGVSRDVALVLRGVLLSR
jgi:Zn-dependent protease